jgi:DNA modification methylase
MNLINKFIQADTFEYIKQIPDEVFDAIHTDPPYGRDTKYGIHHVGSRRIHNDSNLDDWLPDTAREMYRVLKNNSFCQRHSFKQFVF